MKWEIYADEKAARKRKQFVSVRPWNILGLSLAALLWMTISLLFRYGYMILNREERLIFQTPSLQMYVLTAVLLALLLLVRPLLQKVPERGYSGR